MNFKKLSQGFLALALSLSIGVPAWGAYVSVHDNTISTAKIVDSSITQAKLAARTTGTTVAAGGVAISSSSGNFSNGATTSAYIDVTNLSVTITTTGRPVRVMLISANNGTSPGDGIVENGNGNVSIFSFNRGGTILNTDRVSVGTGPIYVPCSSLEFLDTSLAAGTYTYKLQIYSTTASNVQVTHCKMVVYEI